MEEVVEIIFEWHFVDYNISSIVYHHATYTIPKEMLDKFRVDDQQELALVN